MAHLKGSTNLGTVSKMVFIFSDSFSLGSGSQAAVKNDSIGEEICLNSVSAGENRTPPT